LPAALGRSDFNPFYIFREERELDWCGPFQAYAVAVVGKDGRAQWPVVLSSHAPMLSLPGRSLSENTVFRCGLSALHKLQEFGLTQDTDRLALGDQVFGLAMFAAFAVSREDGKILIADNENCGFTCDAVNGGVKTGHAAAQKSATMARA